LSIEGRSKRAHSGENECRVLAVHVGTVGGAQYDNDDHDPEPAHHRTFAPVARGVNDETVSEAQQRNRRISEIGRFFIFFLGLRSISKSYR
jgi:hypothetical protein